MPSRDLSQKIIDGVNVGAGEVIILGLGLGNRRVGPADGKWGLSHGHSLEAGSLTPLLTRLALFCCPGKVQNLLFQVVQLVEVRDSLPGLMTTGLALSPAPGIDEQSGGGRRAALSPSMLLQDSRVMVMVLPRSLFWC